MSGWPRRGGWRDSSPLRGARHGPRGPGRGRCPRGGIREGSSPPPRAVALDREAPPGECALKGRGCEYRAAGVDPRPEAVRTLSRRRAPSVAGSATAVLGHPRLRGSHRAGSVSSTEGGSADRRRRSSLVAVTANLAQLKMSVEATPGSRHIRRRGPAQGCTRHDTNPGLTQVGARSGSSPLVARLRRLRDPATS